MNEGKYQIDTMKFDLENYTNILESTPKRIKTIINSLSHLFPELADYQLEEDHFTIIEVIGHLIHGEEDDWIPRIKLVIENQTKKELPTFVSFDPRGFEEIIKNTDVEELVEVFYQTRMEKIEILKSLQLNDEIMKLKAIHPALGEVNILQLLNTWVVHD